MKDQDFLTELANELFDAAPAHGWIKPEWIERLHTVAHHIADHCYTEGEEWTL